MENTNEGSRLSDEENHLVLASAKLKETLEARGEAMGYGNVLSLVFLTKAGCKLDETTDYKSYQKILNQVDPYTLAKVNLNKVKQVSDEIASSLDMAIPKLTDNLTIPVEDLKIPRTMADIDNEVISETLSGSDETKVDVYRYTDTVGSLDVGIHMDPGEIVQNMEDLQTQGIVAHAKGLRWPLKSILDVSGSSTMSPFSIKQMLDYSPLILQRTKELLNKNQIYEPRYSDGLCRQLLLSQRELLAKTIQSEGLDTAFLSASLDKGGLNNWGRYRIKTSIPMSQLLNVRDLSIQYRELMGFEAMSDPEKMRVQNTLHNLSRSTIKLENVGGRQLDEFSILGGIRKDRVEEIFDTEQEKVIWPISKGSSI